MLVIKILIPLQLNNVINFLNIIRNAILPLKILSHGKLSCMQWLHATKLHCVTDPLHAIHCMQFCLKQVASLNKTCSIMCNLYIVACNDQWEAAVINSNGIKNKQRFPKHGWNKTIYVTTSRTWMPQQCHKRALPPAWTLGGGNDVNGRFYGPPKLFWWVQYVFYHIASLGLGVGAFWLLVHKSCIHSPSLFGILTKTLWNDPVSYSVSNT